jgi:hypothetical protein
MDTHNPEHAQLLIQTLQIDARAAEFQAEEYRRLLLSLIGQGVADATTQIRTDVRSLTISKSRDELIQRARHNSHPFLQETRAEAHAGSRWPQPQPQPQQPHLRHGPPHDLHHNPLHDPDPQLQPQPDPNDLNVLLELPGGRLKPEYLLVQDLCTHAPHTLTLSLQRIFVSRTRRRILSRALSSRHDESEGTSTHVSESTFSESTASSHENDNANDAPRPDFPVSVSAILSRANITSFRLSWGEQERANSTPKVSQSTITRIFGSRLRSDWVQCRGDYKQLFYAKPTVQPFGPTSIGGPGLALLGPAWIDTQNHEESFTLFHVFVAASLGKGRGAPMTAMEYMGDYTIVPLQQHIDWSLLPRMVRSSCFILYRSDVILGSAKGHGSSGCVA